MILSDKGVLGTFRWGPEDAFRDQTICVYGIITFGAAAREASQPRTGPRPSCYSGNLCEHCECTSVLDREIHLVCAFVRRKFQVFLSRHKRTPVYIEARRHGIPFNVVPSYTEKYRKT